jgi:hypothetical protein
MEVEVEEKLPPRVKDRTGMRFGRLVAERFVGIAKRPNGMSRGALWACTCQCGSAITVRVEDLLSGHTQSCGCVKREITVKRNIERTTHGHTRGALKAQGGTPTYRSFRSMIERCERPNHKSFAYYGGRPGNPVQICERLRSFEGFLSEMGERPEGHTLDRIDNDRGYHCGGCGHCEAKGWKRNVRWNSYAGQIHNSRSTKLTAAKVSEIRSASGSQREIAARFGITQGHVSDIKLGKRWADVGSAA